MLGKAEGEGKQWHGHVTAVTVAPECRRLGLATKLMNTLEETTEKVYVTPVQPDVTFPKEYEPQPVV